jgi:enamine deaminase RidA (YjgF/YER057c/UK114 family)
MKKQLIYKIDDTERMRMAGTSGPAAQCWRVGNFVYMTGQTAFTLEGELVGVGDPAAQARQACENIKTLMEMAGGAMSDVIKIITYVTDRAHRDEVYPVVRSYFDLRPCGTGIVVDGLARPELLVEIDAWGFIDDPEDSEDSNGGRTSAQSDRGTEETTS